MAGPTEISRYTLRTSLRKTLPECHLHMRYGAANRGVSCRELRDGEFMGAVTLW